MRVRVRKEGGEHERSELVHNKESRAWRREDGTRGKLRQLMAVLNVVGLTLRSGGSLPHRNTADRGERREEERRVCPHNIVGGEGGTYGCARQNAFQSSEEGVEVVVLGGVEDALHLKLRIPALLAGGRVEVLGGGAVGRRAERVGVEGGGGQGGREARCELERRGFAEGG